MLAPIELEAAVAFIHELPRRVILGNSHTGEVRVYALEGAKKRQIGSHEFVTSPLDVILRIPYATRH